MPSQSRPGSDEQARRGPGFGLPPKHLDEVLGRHVDKAVTRGTPLSWDLLK